MKKQDNNFYTLNKQNINNGFGLITSKKTLGGNTKKAKIVASHLLCEESFNSNYELVAKIDYHYTKGRLDVGVCSPQKASFTTNYISSNIREIRYYQEGKLMNFHEVETLNNLGLVVKKVTYANNIATEQVEYSYDLKEYGGLNLPLLVKETYSDLTNQIKITAHYIYKDTRLISIDGSPYSSSFTYKSNNERIKTNYENGKIMPGMVIQLLDDYGNVIKNKYYNENDELIQTTNFKYIYQ